MYKKLFYSPINISSKNVLFWGCLHYDHKCEHWDDPLWKKRGFTSVEKHNSILLDRWNQKAGHDSVGVILGDIMFGRGGEDKFLCIMRRLNFKELYVCAGNHFSGFKQCLESLDENVLELSSEKKVVFCPNYFELIVSGQPIVCCHYPILSFNGQSRYSWHLYSHVHGSLESSEIGRMYKNSGVKAYEVSVEVNPSPISFDELNRIMRKKSGATFDHHKKDDNNPL